MTRAHGGRRPRDARTARTFRAVLLALVAGAASGAAAGLAERPVEHIRGIYLQRAIEIATVGTRTVRLTRMTRFRRCGNLRGIAEDFNHHLVEVIGREVEGIGFVAGIVNAIEGCASTNALDPGTRDENADGNMRGRAITTARPRMPVSPSIPRLP